MTHGPNDNQRLNQRIKERSSYSSWKPPIAQGEEERDRAETQSARVAQLARELRAATQLHTREVLGTDDVHLYDLRRNRSHCPRLQRAFNTYGEVSFVFEVLVVCSATELLSEEANWINMLDAVNNGYTCSNDTRSGAGPSAARLGPDRVA